MDKKRRQHYVWKYYLTPWTVDDMIVCHREGKIFTTNPINVANKRDFYRLKEITEEDINFIKSLFITNISDEVREIHELLFANFTLIFDLKKQLNANKGIEGELKQEIEEKIEILINNTEEDLHNSIENSVTGYSAHLN